MQRAINLGVTDESGKAVSQLRFAILDAAWQRRMTSYSENAVAVTLTDVEPNSTLMDHLLGAVFRIYTNRSVSRPPTLLAMS